MKDRIRKLCPDLEESRVEDFNKIAALLATQSLSLAPYFLTLEQRLNEAIVRKNVSGNPDHQAILFNRQHGKRFKILTDVFTTWAAENGFHPSLAKINYYLPPRVFRSMQAGGYLFNDKGSSLEHGEWTHTIQWYLITEANNHHPFLENQPADLYVALSRDDNRSKIWNMIFDLSSQQKNLSPHDFRCPGNLHAHLMSNDSKQKYPILHALISKQEARMTNRAHSIGRRQDVEIREKCPQVGGP